uniref:ALBINO3-like protein 1, chloroplastic n=1 Tax=Aegilops tauschii TaxID=37682 RepID=N1QUG8_AEGTA
MAFLTSVPKVLKDGLLTLHVPYPYGFAIILLTVLIKGATFPLTKKQVESALAMRSLQPQVKAIQERHAGDQERIQLETAHIYKLSGVDPLAGSYTHYAWYFSYQGLNLMRLFSLKRDFLRKAFFGYLLWLVQQQLLLEKVAKEYPGFFHLRCPKKTDTCTRMLCSLAGFDGHPPLGWSDTMAYLVLPILLVISQYLSAQIMQSSQSNDPSQQGAQAAVKFLPLLIGYFALSVPSGLSLYWLTNNVLSSAQQVWLQKLGGAKNPVQEYIDKLAREESTNVGKYEPADKSEVLPKAGKPQPGQVPKPSEPQRGGRFKKLMEEESRRKQLVEQAKQTEEASVDSFAIDGKQDFDSSAPDTKDEQEESHENEPISASSNGGLSHDTHEATPNRNTEEGTIQEATDADSHSSVSNAASPSDNRLRGQDEDGKDAE